MPNGTDEELRRLYHQLIGETAEAFGHEIGGVVNTNMMTGNLPSLDIAILEVTFPDDFYPNDYGASVLGVLRGMGYQTASYPLNVNGRSSLFTVPDELVKNRLGLIVDIHANRLLGKNYLERVENSAYAVPQPPPGSLWVYREGRVTRLRKAGV